MSLEDLFRAIAAGRGVAELEGYLSAGGTPNDRDPLSGWCLLQQACEHLNHPVIHALLLHGADVNARAANDIADTPLHQAVDIDIDSVDQCIGDLRQVTFETSRLLLEAGANPDLPDARGRTPRDIAAGYGYGSELAEQFNRICLEARSIRRLGGG
jgi:ankyrin repeat protein